MSKNTPTPAALAAALDDVQRELDAFIDSTGLRGIYFGATERRGPDEAHARGSVVVSSPTPGDWSVTVGADDIWWTARAGYGYRKAVEQFREHDYTAQRIVTMAALTMLRDQVPVDLPAPYLAAA